MGPRYVDSLQRSHKTSYADHEDQRSTIKKNVRSKFEEAMQAFARHLARVMGIRKPRVKILESSVSQGGKGGGKGDKGNGKSDPSGKANSASEASTVTKKKKAVKKKVTYAHAAADDSDESDDSDGSYNMSGMGMADDDDDIDVAIYKELAAYRKMLRTFKLKNGKPRYSKTSIDTKVQRYSEEMYATGTT